MSFIKLVNNMKIRKKEILFIFLSLVIFTSNAINQDAYELNDHPDDLLPRRIARATDAQLALEVERMQNIARLVTGISIQVSLLDGKTSSDDVVSGLLNLGNVSVSQIASRGVTHLQGTLGVMETLPSALNIQQYTSAEQKLEVIEEMRKMVEGLDTTTWQGKQEFETDMKTVKADGVNMTVPMALYGNLKSWIAMFTAVNTMIFDPSKASVLSGTIPVLKLNSEEIKKHLDQLVTDKMKTWTYPKIKNATDALNSLKKTVDAVQAADSKKQHLKLSSTDVADLEYYYNSLKSLSDVSKKLTNEFSSLELVRSLTRPNGFVRGHAGFWNGSKDIDRIFTDLKDSWMRKVVDADEMATSLKPLKSLAPAFSKVETKLQSLNDYQSRKVQKLFEVIDGLMAGTYDYAGMNDAAQSYTDCSEKFAPSGTVQLSSINALSGSADELDKKVAGLDDLVDNLVVKLNTDDVKNWLNKTIELAVLPQDNTQLGATLNAIKQSSEVVSLSAVLANAELITFNQAIAEIQNSAENLLAQMSTIDSFFKDISVYSTFFNCIGKDKQRADVAAQAMATVKKVRGIPPQDMKDGGTILIEVVKTMSSGLSNLQSAIKNMKAQVTGKPTALEKFSDSKKHSETLGPATRAISAMQSAIGKKDQLRAVVRSIGLVETRVDNSTLNQTDKANLKAIVLLKKPLEAMFPMLEAWKTGLEVSDTPVLASHSDVFTSAAKVPGVATNLAETSKAVESLASAISDPAVKTELANLKKSLDSLGDLDLDFASYSAPLTASAQSLKALDVFLNEKESDTESGLPMWVFVLLGALLFAVVIGLVVGAILYFVVLKKKKPEEKRPEENKPVGKVETLAVKSKSTESAESVENPPEPHLPLRAKFGPDGKPIKVNDKYQPTEQEFGLLEMENFDVNVPTVKQFQDFVADLANRLRSEKDKLAKLPEYKTCQKQLNGYAMASFCASIWDRVNAVMTEKNKAPGRLRQLTDEEKMETRGDVPLIEKTRFVLGNYGNMFKSNFIHASYFVFQSKLKMIVTQAPQAKESKNGVVTRHSTIEKFYYMLMQSNAAYVLNLCDRDDDDCNKYLPPKNAKKVTEFDKLTVWVSEKDEHFHSYTIRSISYQFVDYAKRKVKILLPAEPWGTKVPRVIAADLADMMSEFRNSVKRTIVVHCSDGVSRSGVLAHVEMSTELVCTKEGPFDYDAALTKVCEFRAGAIQSNVELAYSYNIIAEHLNMNTPDKVVDKNHQYIGVCYESLRDRLDPSPKPEKFKPNRPLTPAEQAALAEKKRKKSKAYVMAEWREYIAQVNEDERLKALARREAKLKGSGNVSATGDVAAVSKVSAKGNVSARGDVSTISMETAPDETKMVKKSASKSTQSVEGQKRKRVGKKPSQLTLDAM